MAEFVNKRCSFVYETLERDGDDDDYHANNKYKKNKFIILTEEHLRSRIEDDIFKVSSLLSVSREAAIILLCRFDWDVKNLTQDWLADQESVRAGASGLFRQKSSGSGKMDFKANDDDDDYEFVFVCGICREDYPISIGVVASDACGHLFCNNCLKEFLAQSVNDGCFMLSCPEDSCGAAIGRKVIESSLSEVGMDRYKMLLLRSYLESCCSETLKLCPTPGCGCAVEFLDRVGKNFDVSCKCMHGFCWNCLGEAHGPVDCETSATWAAKNSSDLETENWLLAKTKPCPKCQMQIESTEGVKMTCALPCGYNFCWSCSAPWIEHDGEEKEIGGFSVGEEKGIGGVFDGGEKGIGDFFDGEEKGIGGFFDDDDDDDEVNGRKVLACNISQKNGKKEGVVYDEDEKQRRQMAGLLWNYYERWYENHYSMERALLDLQLMKNEKIQILSRAHDLDQADLHFIVDAWVQVVECKRVLKWACVYGYYFQQNEQNKKKDFLDYLISFAESVSHRLHEYLDKEVAEWVESECFLDTFFDFRTKLAGMTRVTGKHFADLVADLESGFADMAASSKIIMPPELQFGFADVASSFKSIKLEE